jgi:hypothetical protein
MGTAHADQAVWTDAEERVRAEIRRVDAAVDDLRAGTGHLHWQGPGAGRFRWRTDRRVRELHDQRATLTLLLSLLGRAGNAAQAQAKADAKADAKAKSDAKSDAKARAKAGKEC